MLAKECMEDCDTREEAAGLVVTCDFAEVNTIEPDISGGGSGVTTPISLELSVSNANDDPIDSKESELSDANRVIDAQLNRILFPEKPMDMNAIIAEFHKWCEIVSVMTTPVQEFLFYISRQLASKGHGRLVSSKAISIAICILSSKLTPSKLALPEDKKVCEGIIAQLTSLSSAYQPNSRSKDRELIMKVSSS